MGRGAIGRSTYGWCGFSRTSRQVATCDIRVVLISIEDRTMREHRLEPDRLASSLFLFHPDEAYEIALDFLNGALSTQDRDGAMAWTAVLPLLEKMQADYESQADHVREMRCCSIM